MAATLTGIPQSSIGPTYDLGLAANPFTGTAQVYGYVLAPGSEWEEGTDLQDAERLVQIASPNSSDRWSTYPQISQGEWSGGERQLIFVDPTRYYQSTKLETAIPGHLRIAGRYIRTSFPSNVGNPQNYSRSVAIDTANSGGFAVAMSGGSSGNLAVFRWSSSAFGAITQRMGPSATVNGVVELINAGTALFGIIQGGTTPGVWQVTASNGTSEITSDSAEPGTLSYIANSIWYSLTSALQNIWKAVYTTAWPGNAAGTAAQATNVVEAGVQLMSSSPSGLVFVTSPNVLGTPSYIYTWDGASVPVQVGLVRGLLPVDIRTVAGITFILFAGTSPPGITTPYQPVIYSLTGSQLAVFDDYRYLDPAFQNAVTTGSQYGNLDGDDTFLYLAWPGLDLKRYDLANTGGQSIAVSDVGDPARAGVAAHSAVAGASGSFFEWSDNPNSTNHLLWGTVTTASDTGTLTTSYFDAGVPDVVKSWRTFEIQLNATLGTGAAVAVAYQLDNQTGFPHTLTMTADTAGNLVGFFPNPTRAKRIQLQLTLTASTAGVSPDIRSYSVLPTLGRVWRVTVLCQAQPVTHTGDDTQGATSTQLLANIASIYANGGRCTLFVPDPTSTTGVSQVNAILQDYTRHTRFKPGPTMDEFHGWIQEGSVDLVLAEDL